MTPEERVALVKRVYREIGRADPEYADPWLDDIAALLEMLVDAEARADRAEFYREHRVTHDYSLNDEWCEGCNVLLSDHLVSDYHTWTPDDWRAAVRARYGMEG